MGLTRLLLIVAHDRFCFVPFALQGFKTKAMRDIEVLQKTKVYTSTLLRVQMPDRTVLQGVFSPLEPVAALHAWARSCIRATTAEGEPVPFYLMTTPPPVVVAEAEDRTLGEAGLQPAALVYLVWGSAPDKKLAAELCPTDPATYLTPEIYATSQDPASAAATPFPTSAPVVEPQRDTAAEDAAAAALLAGRGAAAPKPSSSGSGGSGKAPAWLKLGSK
jgi:hypothetical protein